MVEISHFSSHLGKSASDLHTLSFPVEVEAGDTVFEDGEKRHFLFFDRKCGIKTGSREIGNPTGTQ